jgi:hypothetical protein
MISALTEPDAGMQGAVSNRLRIGGIVQEHCVINYQGIPSGGT